MKINEHLITALSTVGVLVILISITVIRFYYLPLGPYASPDDFPAVALTLIGVLILVVAVDLARGKMTCSSECNEEDEMIE